METSERVCNKCYQSFPLSEFYFAYGKPTARCKPCTRTINVKFNTDNRLARNAAQNARRYGLDVSQYEALMARKECGICGANDAGGRGSFHIDHCHASGKVRGILCHRCNTGLGSLGDTVESLKLAMAYLVDSGLAIKL